MVEDPGHRRARRRIAVLAVLMFGALALATAMAAGLAGALVCLFAAVAAGALAATMTRHAVSQPSQLRTTVVLGMLAYLVGLPLLWSASHHLDAVVGADTSRAVPLGVLVAVFVIAFVAASRWHPRGDGEAARRSAA